MAINKNHEFEELNGIKCGIVEKNVPTERVVFLKRILEYNGYNVIAVPSPAPKVAPPAILDNNTDQIPSSIIETFTIGVTDYTFNPINAIFGRLLKSPEGNVVTLAFWNQLETISDDAIPYYEKKNIIKYGST